MTTVERPLSCGTLITSPAGWLLAHATATPRWDLPKGRLEPDETPLQAALRETWEEVGLDLSPYADRLIDLGRRPYLRAKDLHLFRLDLDQAWDLSGCVCHSFLERHGRQLPETDDYAWVPVDQVHLRVGPSLVRYFQKMGLLP